MGQGVADRREAIAAYDAAGDGASPLFLAEARAAASEAWDAAAVARDAAAAERDAAALREQAAAEKVAELRLRIQAELDRVQTALKTANQVPFGADGASAHRSGLDVDKPPLLGEIIPSPDEEFEACEGAQQQLSSLLPVPLRTAAVEDSAHPLSYEPLPLGPHKAVHPPRKFKGVRLDKTRIASNRVKCWRADICGNGSFHGRSLGYFETQEEAASAFDDEQRRLGLRYCNFPRQGEILALRPGVNQDRRASGGGAPQAQPSRASTRRRLAT